MNSLAADLPAQSVEVRRLDTPAEYLEVESVQREAWGFPTYPLIHVPIQRALNDNGGLVLGAFAGTELIGFSLGFLGREEGRRFHYSHMTGVRPSWQRRHVGLSLKLRQREEVLHQGLDEIRWTYDPLQTKNASLNVRRLGGTPDRYLPRYYGEMADGINRGLDTDRVRLVWRLRDPHVEERLRRPLLRPGQAEERLARSETLIETALGPTGIRRPVDLRAPTSPSLNLEIPFELTALRAHDRADPQRWREATRAAFTRALAEGYAVDDFAVVNVRNERRSFYFLERGSGAHGD